ncbi:TetR/AcrR family transcriptional regulator [Saccharomonospora viridis]|uniref:TetR family transcriptional regulator n=1 Tax=Saccharomonospora viridis TaxID=1852 RepID=A0A837DCH2_9PSEU|nr:TetR/AcrR family transcriptional regulator [Saccharomonospora viridis]KHF44074.1 TetR family transcriptional regulator [Saccharomonospora viridis]SFP55851.1 transcriptional regulator, TetR family [Saccharomonospora viridis]
MALDTRERVRKAAVKLFADKGFHGTGIRELAQESRLSTASLYHYMGSKEDLLVDIMRTCLQSLRDSATAAVADVRDPVQRLTTLVKLHVKAHARMPKETWIVDNEIHVLSPALRRSVIALRDEYERLWAEAISDGVERGVFDTAHPAVTRIALLEMCNGVARWYSPRGSLSLDDLAEHYADMALRVLGACPHGSAEGQSKSE